MHDQRGHGDGAQTVADVVAAAQGGKALQQVGHGDLLPLGLPQRRARPAIAQDDVRHHGRDLVGQPALQPVFHQHLVAGHFLRIFLQSLCVDQHQRTHKVRVRERAAQRQIPALRHAGQHGLLHVQVRQQRSQVVGRVVVGEGVAVRRVSRLAMAAFVPGDAAPLAAQRLHLRREHTAVHEQSVGENDGRAVSTRVFVIQLLAVDVRERHAVLLYSDEQTPIVRTARPGTQRARPAQRARRVTWVSARTRQAHRKQVFSAESPYKIMADSYQIRSVCYANARWMMIFCTSLVPS